MSKFYNEMVGFAQANVAPHTKKVDDEACFPEESFKAILGSKKTGLLVPEAFGGQGKGLTEHAEAVMALAESCATTGLCYMMHNVATMCIVLFGSDEMKKKFLPKIASGEVLFALAYSETGTGTHFYLPEITVAKDKENYVLNGRKSFVTSAEYADYYLVLSNSADTEGLDNWIIPKDAKGLSFQREAWNGLGMRGNASMPMLLENVTLDGSYRIGDAGSGQAQVFNVVAPFFVTGLACVYAGVANNACATVVEHAKTRKYTDGTMLAAIPTVQNHLAEIYTKAAGAKHFALAAAKAGSEGSADALAQIIAARLNASDAAVEVCTKAMKIGGGTAYAKRLPLERLLRDSLAAAVMAPSTDVLSIWLGKALTDQPIP